MPSYGTTWDGIDITPGLIVFTNEMRVGKVESAQRHSPGWFTVRYRNGAGVLQNAERVATHFEGRDAAKVYATEHDWVYPGGVGKCALCGTTDAPDRSTCPKAPTD